SSRAAITTSAIDSTVEAANTPRSHSRHPCKASLTRRRSMGTGEPLFQHVRSRVRRSAWSFAFGVAPNPRKDDHVETAKLHRAHRRCVCQLVGIRARGGRDRLTCSM